MDKLAADVTLTEAEEDLLRKEVEAPLDGMFGERIDSIAAICNIPSAKSKEYLSQNLEKLFNSIVPESDDDWYSVIIFAE